MLAKRRMICYNTGNIAEEDTHMNLSQLAKLADVSVATVSKAFAGSHEISEATRQRIFDLARENNIFDKYNKNRFSKPVIAVLCPEFVSNYYKVWVAKTESAILASDGLMIVSSSGFDPVREQELFTYYAYYCRVDGIILINPISDIHNPTRVPAVAIGPGSLCRDIDALHIDLKTAMDDAIACLRQNGHTDIGFAGETLTTYKRSIFFDAMKKARLPVRPEWIKESKARYVEAGAEAAAAWLREGTLPTAVVAAYDDVAMGLQRVLEDNGLRIPDDVSLIGMDDNDTSAYLSPPLSSIRTHMETACRQAVEILLCKRDNQFYSPRTETVLTATFEPRASIGPVKKK